MSLDNEETKILNNIREVLKFYIGKTLVDVTSNDPDEEEPPYTCLMFEDGLVLKFYGSFWIESDLDGLG